MVLAPGLVVWLCGEYLGWEPCDFTIRNAVLTLFPVRLCGFGVSRSVSFSPQLFTSQYTWFSVFLCSYNMFCMYIYVNVWFVSFHPSFFCKLQCVCVCVCVCVSLFV